MVYRYSQKQNASVCSIIEAQSPIYFSLQSVYYLFEDNMVQEVHNDELNFCLDAVSVLRTIEQFQIKGNHDSTLIKIQHELQSAYAIQKIHTM